MDSEIENILQSQGRTIAVLSLRIAALEKVLTDNNIIKKDELHSVSVELSEEFAKRAEEEIKKIKVKKG